MSRLDDNRKIVADGVKKFEKRGQEIHTMADKLHKKMEQLHREGAAIKSGPEPPAKTPNPPSHRTENDPESKIRKTN
jgi:hypothetical protein